MRTDCHSSEYYGLSLHVIERGRQARRARSKSVAVAQIGKHIIFDPDILDRYHYDGWKPVHHDLLVVSAAVEFADRRCARRTTRWSRQLKVTVPVTEIAVWQHSEVQEHLHAALRHLTGDDWHFSFVQANKPTASLTRQRSLPFASNKRFAIAYSDGIDSRCVAELYGRDDSAVRVRVAKNRSRAKEGELPFDQIPFKVKVKPSPESSVRSRGFKFAVIAAVAGQLSGLSKIIVPESGQSALGPVLLPLHNVYPDYRNHPTYFRLLERFLRALLEYRVTYEQPRLWHTKGQTISAFLRATNKPAGILAKTRSCWQQRWNAKLDGKLRQCGLCAACLLRRMSMHAAGVTEPSDAYVISNLSAGRYESAVPQSSRIRLSPTMMEYGIVGARHLQQLADMADLPDGALRIHAFEIAQAMGILEHETHDNLRNLLLTHAKEWRAFIAAQGEKSFLNAWTRGGRDGRSQRD